MNDPLAMLARLPTLFFFLKQEYTRVRISHLLVLGTLLGLAACAGNDEAESEIQNLTEAYESAQESIARAMRLLTVPSDLPITSPISR